MGAHIGDDDPHRPADQGADRKGAGEREGESGDPGLRAAERLQDPGGGEPADVGGEGHREVETPGQDRDQHREGQDSELRHLEGNRLKRGEGEEPRRRPAEEDDHRDEEEPQPDVFAAPGPEQGGQIREARGARPAQARLRQPRSAIASQETFVVVIAARSTTPISIWNA